MIFASSFITTIRFFFFQEHKVNRRTADKLYNTNIEGPKVDRCFLFPSPTIRLYAQSHTAHSYILFFFTVYSLSLAAHSSNVTFRFRLFSFAFHVYFGITPKTSITLRSVFAKRSARRDASAVCNTYTRVTSIYVSMMPANECIRCMSMYCMLTAWTACRHTNPVVPFRTSQHLCRPVFERLLFATGWCNPRLLFSRAIFNRFHKVSMSRKSILQVTTMKKKEKNNKYKLSKIINNFSFINQMLKFVRITCTLHRE